MLMGLYPDADVWRNVYIQVDEFEGLTVLYMHACMHGRDAPAGTVFPAGFGGFGGFNRPGRLVVNLSGLPKLVTKE